MSILSCITYTHKILSMFSYFQTKCISFSKHEVQTLFLVLWVEVTHNPPFYSLNLNCMGAIHLEIFIFTQLYFRMDHGF